MSADRNRRLGSRNPVGRPRRIAGQGSVPESPPAEQPAEPVVEQRAPADPVVEQRASASVVETPEADQPPQPRRTLGGTRTTIALLVTIVLLLGIGAGEVVYLAHDGDPTVSAKRPVVTGELTYRTAVEAAARSTEDILSTSYEGYDDQVEQATTKMTDAFAAQYRETSDGIRDSFIAQKTELQVKAVAQAVVQASAQQVQALLFLDQYVEKVDKAQPRTDYRQYRALVTVVRTDAGWLVSDIETQ